MKVEKKRLIEEWLPIGEINLNAEIETAFRMTRQSRELRKRFVETFKVNPLVLAVGTPQISNIHLYLARRPCSTARALTTASLIQAGCNQGDFLRIIGLDQIPQLAREKILPILININPDRDLLNELLKRDLNKSLKEIVVVDPMAGGGAIPLESLRLGLNTVAMDYNPVAYILIKATLEYPARYGKKLYEDVKKEVGALLGYAKSEFTKYYAMDAYNYIFARGFNCPNSDCGGLIPIIHNLRLRRDGPYIKLDFDRNFKTFAVSIVKEQAEFEKLRCPYCGRPFTNEEVFKQWIPRHKSLLKIALEGNQIEASKHRDELLITHIPLVKQVKRGFTPCNEEDRELFFRAYVDLTKEIGNLSQYIPPAPIPIENEVFQPVKDYGIAHWYELYNTRQILVFSKLVKYIDQRTKELKKRFGDYGFAVSMYLALGLDKLLDYNNIATMWDTIYGTVGRLGDQYAAKKSVGLGLEYCELVAPLENKSLGWVYEPDIDRPTATTGGVCPVLRELCGWLEGLGDRIEVYMGNAGELTKSIGESSSDLVNVDPPYFNQHMYSDLSEYFWQWLSLTLKPAIEAGFLFNRDKEHGRVECLVSGWSPILSTVPRSEEMIVRRHRNRITAISIPHTNEWWKERMYKFFSEAYRCIKDDGLLVVWYTHSNPEAWESVLSGLYASNFTISKVWTIRTEAGRFIVRVGGTGFFTSMALVARKGGNGTVVGERNPAELLSNQQVEKSIFESVDDAFKSANISGASDKETFIMALAGAIAGATKIRNPSIETIHITKQEVLINETSIEEGISKQRFYALSRYFRESLYPVALYIGTSRILEDELQKAGLQQDKIKLVVGSDNYSRAYLAFWISSRYSEESNVNYDFSEKICKVVGVTVDGLKNFGLLDKVEKDVYQVLFGREIIDAVRNRVETLDRTSVGQSMYIFKLIVDSPIRDDPERCARQVLTIKPVSRQVISTALFLLRTAKEDELRKASISLLNKPYVEKVLESLYSR